MPTVRELIYSIGFKVDSKPLDRAEQSANKADVGFQRIGLNASMARTKIVRMVNSARAQLPFLRKEAEDTGNSLAAAFAGLGVGAALTIGATKMIATIGEFERLKAQLLTILGDQGLADQTFKQLQQFAATTPFQLTELTNSFAKLSAVGLNPTMEDMRDFGNIAAGMGKSFDQFTEAVTDASTGEFERLKEFGIVSKSEGDKVTFLFKGVKTTVKKESKEIVNYLKSVSQANFAGGMDRQAATVMGAFSNLMDSLDAFFAQIGSAGLATELNLFLRELGAVTGESEGLATVIGRVLGFAIRNLRDALKWAKDNSAELTAALGLLATAMAIKGVYKLTTAMIELGLSFAKGSAPMVLAAAAILMIGLAVEDLIQYFTNGSEASEIGKWFENTFGVQGPVAVARIKEILLAVAAALILVFSLFNPILGLALAFAFLATTILEYWDQIPGAFANMFSEIFEFFKNLIGLMILETINFLGSIKQEIFNSSIGLFLPFLSSFMTIISAITTAFNGLLSIIGDRIKEIPAMAKAALASVPGIQAAINAGGNVLEFFGAGASNPGVDAARRVNEISNNSRKSETNITASIPITVQGAGANDVGMIDELETRLEKMLERVFNSAATDLDGSFN